MDVAKTQSSLARRGAMRLPSVPTSHSILRAATALSSLWATDVAETGSSLARRGAMRVPSVPTSQSTIMIIILRIVIMSIIKMSIMHSLSIITIIMSYAHNNSTEHSLNDRNN